MRIEIAGSEREIASAAQQPAHQHPADLRVAVAPPQTGVPQPSVLLPRHDQQVRPAVRQVARVEAAAPRAAVPAVLGHVVLRLRGGAGQGESLPFLRLWNPFGSNSCYVNSTLQLLQNLTLTNQLTEDPQRPLCSALARLYNDREEEEAFNIRWQVSQMNGKAHFGVDDSGSGSQEDAFLFLHALEEKVREELTGDNVSNHWGSITKMRRFKHLPEGKCLLCNTVPPTTTDPFLQLPVPVPRSDGHHTLSSVMDTFFALNVNAGSMKCSRCCPHDKTPGQAKTCERECTHYASEDQTSMSTYPDTLFIQLLRYGNRGEKVKTKVLLEEFVNVAGVVYEVQGAIVHRGGSLKSGHYVCYKKTEGQWHLHNDRAPAKGVDLHNIENNQTYLICATKCDQGQQQDEVMTGEQGDENQR